MLASVLYAVFWLILSHFVVAGSLLPASVPEIVGGSQVTITVLYDNDALHPGTEPDWGFACLVEGFEETVLFDTGASGDILLRNMQVLQVDADDIEVVVLSHAHADHTGGLARILACNPDITVYRPVEGPVSLCPGLSVTGCMGSPSESALVVETSEGHVLITGCAHPGIVEMVKVASDLVDGPVFAVLGGFHLASYSPSQVDRIIQELRQLGVQRCGPAHCTGDAATVRFKEAFADGFVAMGVGAVITFKRAPAAASSSTPLP